MGKPEDATRIDPYGEFGHIELVSLEEAARLYREHLNTPRGENSVKTWVTKLKEAEHRVLLAAWGNS